MFYKIAAFICKGLLRLLYKVEVKGDISLSSVRGCIVYANHTCVLDPVVMGGFTNRQIRFMAKTELFKNKLFRYVLLKVGTVPVRRGEGDINAVKTSLRLLKNGEILGMFPEGTRNKGEALMDAEPGLSMIAIRARVPVIPMAISSKYRVFSRIRFSIGEPVYLEEFYGRRLTIKEHRRISNELMAKVSELLKEDRDIETS